MNTLIVVVVFCVLIIVHEWGHFIAAKRLGVKVEKFSVGFGKKIFSRQYKGTEYMICAVPFGGFVKMAGDERSECKGTTDEFFSHPIWHRALIIVMGPIVNFLFAYLCFYFLFVTGFPMSSSKIGKVLENYPAYEAGILEGDQVIKIDDKDIMTWSDLEQTIKDSGGKEMQFTLLRGNETITKSIVPQEKILKDLLGQETQAWVIGIQTKGSDFILVKAGIGESFGKAFDQLYKIVTVTLKAVYRIITGAMPAKGNVGGPILIFIIIKSAATMGLPHLIFITGVISASLALVNLFPVPVLDGGHLVFLAIEKVRKKPLSVKVEEGLTKFGFGLLLCLMIFLLFNDVSQMGWFENLKETFIDFKN